MYISKFGFLILLALICWLSTCAFAQDNEKMENVTITIDSTTGEQHVVIVKDNDDVPDTIIVKHSHKKIKAKVNTELKNNNDDLQMDDAIDNDMYTPYEKWRIDQFDDWGKHKPKSQIKNADTINVDTKIDLKKKSFSDHEKEE